MQDDGRGLIFPDRRWTLTFALLVMLLTSLPYLVGFQTQGADWRFTGFLFGVDDGNSYIAKILSGSAGAWLFRTPYTSMPQRGVLAFLPYILLGKLAAPPAQHEQLAALYHLYRFAAGVLAILATGDFLALFVKSLRWRRLALVAAVLGGGLGWILLLFTGAKTLPLEFYSPETFGFLALYGLPHLALARALLLWGLVRYLSEPVVSLPESSGFRIADQINIGIKVGLYWLALGLAQPLTVAIGWAVLAAHLAALGLWQVYRSQRGLSAKWGSWKAFAVRAAGAVLLTSPLVLDTFLAFNLDPYLRQWQAQNLILSPPFWHYLLAYGPLIPLAVIGGKLLIRRDPLRGWLPAAWTLLLPFLAYAPYNLQRRLPEGGWVALVALSAAALEGCVMDSQPARERRIWRAATAGVIALLLPSTILLIAGGFASAARPAWPAFQPAQEAAAFDALRVRAQPGQVVLAAFETGNALPAWAPLRVVIGHGPESAGLEQLRPQVNAIFDAAIGDSTRIKFLQDQNVDYVFWGPFERALGGWDPHRAGYLEMIYEEGEYAIFRMR